MSLQSVQTQRDVVMEYRVVSVVVKQQRGLTAVDLHHDDYICMNACVC